MRTRHTADDRTRKTAVFFEGLLNRLNELSDPTAKLIGRRTGIKIAEYDAYCSSQGGYDYGKPAYIRYAREKKMSGNSYTGFTIDLLVGRTLSEFAEAEIKRNEQYYGKNTRFFPSSFVPRLKTIPVTCEYLGNYVVEHRKMREATITNFFNWNLGAAKKEVVIELLEKFPELKRSAVINIDINDVVEERR